MSKVWITWPKAEHEAIAAKHEAVAIDGEKLTVGWENETHYCNSSRRLTAEAQATLEADPDFANVTFSDTPPEGF